MKRSLRFLASAAAIGLAANASAAVITFTNNGGFNDTAQLSTSGTLVEAVHFGNTAAGTVTANGIAFATAGNSTSILTVQNAGGPYTDANLYQPTTHTTGFTAITGLTLAQANTLLDGVVYGKLTNDNLVTLTGLTNGTQYLMQFLLVDDRSNGATDYIKVANTAGYTPVSTLDLDYAQNAVQLVTGTFTADSTTQDFRIGRFVGNNNTELNAYQLRAVPEPATCALLAAGLSVVTVLRRRRMAA